MIKNNWKPNDKHPLSAQWSQTQRMIGNRLSFFGKGITCIDKLISVPQNILNSIKQLDLSHNALIKLENMKQFKNLEVINLAHNHIADGRSIVKLAKLSKIKTILIKGNPFLKSGEGKIEAMKALVKLNTDIEIFSIKVQRKLSNCIEKYCKVQINKQYISHLQMQIGFVNEFRIKVSQNFTYQTYCHVINEVLENKIEETCKETRKQVVTSIMKEKDEDQMEKIENKEDLQMKFDECLALFSKKLEYELGELNKKIDDKIQTLNHVRKMSKEKQMRENSLKKSLSPEKISKIQNKTPLQTRLFSPQRNQNSLFLTTPTKNFTKPSTLTQTTNLKRNPQQNFQTYYLNMLSKYNPVYQLLFSPLTSLKSKQKDLLIETLSIHLKEKSYIVFKNERLKQQYMQLCKKCQQQELIIKESEQKFYQYKMSSNEKFNMLQLIGNERDEQIEELNKKLELTSKQNEQLIQRVEYLEEELGQSKLKDIQLSHKLQRVREEEDIIQEIQSKRETNIKRRIMKIIEYKAKALVKLRNIQKTNRIIENNKLKAFCFYWVKKEVINRRKSNQIKSIVLKKCMKQFLKAAKLQIQETNGSKWISRNKKALFFQILKQKRSRTKKIKNFIRKSNSIRNRVTMSMCFKQWKEQYQMKKHIQNVSKAEDLYLDLLKKRMFQNWQVYVKLPIYKQAELTVDLRTIKIKTFLVSLYELYYPKRLIEEKFLNLIVFLNKSKRISYMAKFRTFFSQVLDRRNCKQKQVKAHLKGKSLCQFLKITDRLKKQSQQLTQRGTKLTNLRRRALIQKLSSQQYKKSKKNKLIRLIEGYRKLSVKQCIEAYVKQFMIEDSHKKQQIKTFFAHLQSNFNEKLKMKNKKNQLKLTLKDNQQRMYETYKNKRQFIENLMKPAIYKARLAQFLRKRYEKLLIKYFNEWKIEVYRNQIQYLKTKIHEFGPEIEQIMKRQKSTHDEKLILMNIIDSKEKAIKGFIHQLEQAQYTIKTKEQKYQKLKEYYYQIGEDITVIGSKVQPAYVKDNKVPERDFDTFFQEDRKEYFNTFRRF